MFIIIQIIIIIIIIVVVTIILEFLMALANEIKYFIILILIMSKIHKYLYFYILGVVVDPEFKGLDYKNFSKRVRRFLNEDTMKVLNHGEIKFEIFTLADFSIQKG